MFREENRIWWYLLGVLVMIVVVFIVGREFVLPIFRGEKSLNELRPFVYTAPPSFNLGNGVDYGLELHTNYGTISIDLFEQNAPQNVNNLVFLAEKGYYDGTKFHRLFTDLLIQGGDRNTLDDDPSNDGNGGPGYFIPDEVNWGSTGLSNEKVQALLAAGYASSDGLVSVSLQAYTVAMASTQPNSIGSQFFIVMGNPGDTRLQELNGYFTVVGRVIAGGQVLESISKIPVDNTDPQIPRPQSEVVIVNARVVSF